jgi:hypothetical protein
MTKQIALKFAPDICDAISWSAVVFTVDGIIVDCVFLQLDSLFCIYVYSAAFPFCVLM